MDLQYISDADGRHTAVVIPIEDWKELTTKHEELRDLEKRIGNRKRELDLKENQRAQWAV